MFVGLFLPYIALAVTFNNPAAGFLLDLTKFRSQNTFQGLFVYIINLVIAVVTILAVGFIIYGGLQYITSRGDEEQATTGKRTLVNAIIGLVIVIVSYTMVTVIINALNNKV